MAYIIRVAALFVCFASAGLGHAGALDVSNSFLELKVGAVPPLRSRATSAPVALTSGGALIDEAPGVFEIDDNANETAVFTGLPMLTTRLLTRRGAGVGSGRSFTSGVGVGFAPPRPWAGASINGPSRV